MKKFLLVAFIGFSLTQLNAQTSTTPDNNIPESGVIYPEYMRISRPLKEIWAEENMNPDELTDFEKRNIEAPDKRVSKRKAINFPMSEEKDGSAYGNDESVLQDEMGTRRGNQTRVNWTGLGNGGGLPYDPSGAAGPDHYVQAVNATTYRIYDKSTGANLGQGSVGSLWSPATGNMGDPIVMYDRFADRWFISQFGQASGNNYMYIAVSTTPDPTGTYYTYSYTSPQFPDYLKFSIWHDGYYMTANTGTQRVFAFERSVMLTGGTARSVYTSYSPPRPSGFFCPMPGDADGNQGLPTSGGCPIFSMEDNGWGGGYNDEINIYNANVTWGTTPSMTISMATGAPVATSVFNSSYSSSWDDISQPGTTQKLDGIGGIIQYRAQYRKWSTYNSVVLTWPVRISSTQRSLMWCELRQTGGTWAMYQQGIYTPDNDTRWVGSISMDDQGNIALCYAKSNATSIYPSLGYTGRLAADPAGQMTFAETMVQNGTGYQSSYNRFGDYAQTTLDPDGMTFWHTAQYNGGSSGTTVQRTRIYSFTLSSVLSAAVSISSNDADNSICTGTSVTFTATPTNGGTSPSYQWKRNGNNVGTNSATYTTTTLANGDVITCVMTSNLSGVINNPATSNAITMTVNAIVTPSVSITSNDADNTICAGSSITFTATPTNGGTPSYQWKRNGNNVGTNSSTFTSTTLANGDVIHVVMTSTASCVTSSTANSNSITVTVTPTVTPSVSIAATDNTICAGESVTFTATPTNGGASPSYQWKRNGNNVGTNSATFTTTTLANGDIITVVLTSNATCPSPATATSNSVTMTVTSIPSTPTITQNGSILTSSSSTGNQWYLDGNLLPGETNQSIIVTQSGVYTVVVTINGCSSASSAGVGATVGIEEEFNPFQLVAFPNPSNGEFMITFNADKSEKYLLEIYNEIGQIVYSKDISGSNGTYQIPVDLNKPAAGMYNIKLSNGNQKMVKKIIIH